MPTLTTADQSNRPGRSRTDCAIIAGGAWAAALVILYVTQSSLGSFPYWALGSAIFLQLQSGATPRDWAVSVALSVPIIALFDFWHLPVALAAGCVAVSSYRWAKGELKGNAAALPIVAAATMLAIAIGMMLLRSFSPHTIDSQLLAIDARWGGSLSVIIWHWCRTHVVANALLLAVYGSLPLVCVILLSDGRTPPTLGQFRVFIFAGLAAVPFYLMFPAVGPEHVGDLHAFRNCVPSLHVTWAALLLLNVRGTGKRAVAAVFLFLTMLATLGLGEHYLVDLAAAMPFTLALQWFSSPRTTAADMPGPYPGVSTPSIG